MKEPKNGEWWQYGNERFICVGVTSIHAAMARKDGAIIVFRLEHVESQWQHLPDCEGWQWKPEVFPQYYLPSAYSTQPCVFHRRDSKTETFGVTKDGYEWAWHYAWEKNDTDIHRQITKEQAEAWLDNPEVWPQYWTTNADESTFAYVVRCGPNNLGDWFVVMKDGVSGPKLDFFQWSTTGRTQMTKEQAEALVTKPKETTPRLVPVRLWCRYERGNKTGHMYVFANTEPPVGAGIKYSEIKSDGNGGWYVEVQL